MIPAQDSQKCYQIQHRFNEFKPSPQGVKVYNKIDFELKPEENRQSLLGLFTIALTVSSGIFRMIWDLVNIFPLDDATIHDYLLLVCKTPIKSFSFLMICYM